MSRDKQRLSDYLSHILEAIERTATPRIWMKPGRVGTLLCPRESR